MRHWTGILAGVAIICNGSLEPAQAISIGVNVGLNGSTQNFLNHYPKVIREQMITALTQAIPLVEQGIDHTFDRADQTIDHAAATFDCSAQVVYVTTVATALSLKSALLGLGDQSLGRTEMTNLDKFVVKERAQITGVTSPQQAEKHYSNILGTAYSARCYYKQVGYNTDIVVARFSDQYANDLTSWFYLDSLGCGAATACYRAAYDETQRDIAAADPRDAAGASARARFAALGIPDSSFANGFDPHFTGTFAAFKKGRFDLNSYEANVHEMVAIQFDMAARNAARVDQANKLIDVDSDQLLALQTRLKVLSDAYGGNSSQALANAFGPNKTSATAIGADLTKLNLSAVLALANIPEFQQQVVALKQSQDQMQLTLASISGGYDARYQALYAAEHPQRRRPDPKPCASRNCY